MEHGIVSINGVLSPAAEAKISVFDRGFLFGDDIFEVFVAFNQQIFALEPHLARLRRSAAQIHLSLPWSDAELAAELRAVVAKLPIEKIYLRLMITRGQGLGLEVREELSPNKIIMALPAAVFPEHHYREGIALKIAPRESTSRGAQAKTGNYLASIIAMQEARTDNFDDILWCNDEGEFTEASTANIFFIARQGSEVEIVTPHLASGLLEGITRNYVMEMLQNSGYAVREDIVTQDELARFDEAFICSTMRGVMPVRRIDGHLLHSRRPRSVFTRIEADFYASIAGSGTR
jgi:branched-chain amino acid aminotransferase